MKQSGRTQFQSSPLPESGYIDIKHKQVFNSVNWYCMIHNAPVYPSIA